jgi:hypothetical protein
MRTETIRSEFEQVLPRITAHAAVVFRSVVCPHTRQELTAEMVALSWRWFRRLRQRGKKNPLRFISAIATFAAKAARSGRRLCGQDKAKDVLSPRARQKHRFTVGSLPAFATLSDNPLSEALSDNTRTPVDEQVAFRLDFPAWLSTLDDRRRNVIEAMAQGERTQDLARMFGVSEARISQMRREFLDSWLQFTGES